MKILNFKRNIGLITLMLQSGIFYSQNLPIIGFGDAVNYTIGNYSVPGSSGLDLHWYGGIRFGDKTSRSVMQITSGNVGIGTETPMTKLDVFKSTPTNDNDVIANFVRAGTPTGGSSIVRFGYHNTCDFEINSGNTSTGWRFGNYFDLNIVNNYTGGIHGGINFVTNATTNMVIRPNGYVGIGTTAPTAKLEVNGSSELFGFSNKVYGNHDSANYYMGHYPVIDSDGLDIHWYGGVRLGDRSGTVLQVSNGNVGIGTIIPDSKLTVNGTIHATEVKVTQTVPADYVFEKYYLGESSLKPDYTLLTLSEVEKFTEANHHLPDVPSAKEIKENGLLLGEMSNVLLQKIEELTLYVIELKKDNEKQNKEIKILKNKLSNK
jgi:hypothetical protein